MSGEIDTREEIVEDTIFEFLGDYVLKVLDVRNLRRALLDKLDAAEGWRTIESAPSRGPQVLVGLWVTPERWAYWLEKSEDIPVTASSVTHWLPVRLPAPPAVAGETT